MRGNCRHPILYLTIFGISNPNDNTNQVYIKKIKKKKHWVVSLREDFEQAQTQTKVQEPKPD